MVQAVAMVRVRAGMQQSPIHFAEGLTYRDLPDRLHASVNLPRVHNMTVKNTGHGLQVGAQVLEDRS